MPLTVSDTDAHVGEYDNYQQETSWRANFLILFFFFKMATVTSPRQPDSLGGMGMTQFHA